MANRVCSACATALEDNEGIELWGVWFCSGCFVSQSGQLHRELKPEDIELLRRMGRELAAILPPDLVELILVGFFKRANKSKKLPPKEELERCAGEIQRITAFACFRRIMNLLKTWQDMFNEFVEGQEQDIHEKIKKLTDLE